MGKNAPFYVILLYVLIFKNIRPTLNEDLLKISTRLHGMTSSK